MDIRVNKLARALNINADTLSDVLNKESDNVMNINFNTKLSIKLVANNEDDLSSIVSEMPLEALYSLQSEVNKMIDMRMAVEGLEIAITKCLDLGIDVNHYMPKPISE